MRENRPYGSEGGAGFIPCPYPYPGSRPDSQMRPTGFNDPRRRAGRGRYALAGLMGVGGGRTWARACRIRSRRACPNAKLSAAAHQWSTSFDRWPEGYSI